MKLNVTKLIKSAQKSISKHSPEILVGLGITGMVTTTVLAVKATPKALMLIEEKKKEEQVESLTACAIGANSVHTRRQAALYSAYKLSETAYTEYREKVKEEIGEEKEKVVHQKAVEEHINNLAFHEDGVVYTGHGNTLFFDPISKVVFRSSQNYIEKTINNLNWKMTMGNEPYISLSDFYAENDLPDYALGNELGWRTDKGCIDISFPAAKTNTGEPCLQIEYLVPPEWDFDSLY